MLPARLQATRMRDLDISQTTRQQGLHQDLRVLPNTCPVGAADLAALRLASCGEAELAEAQALAILLSKRLPTIATRNCSRSSLLYRQQNATAVGSCG